MSYKILTYLLLLSTGGILTLSFLFISGIWRLGSHLTDTLEAFLTLTHPEPKIEHSTLIINQIRGISELTTAVFVMEAVVPTSGERKWGNLVIGKTELLYIAQGQVRAGIDLEALTPEQIKINNNHLSIQLPPVKILDSKIDINQSRVYDYDRGFLGLGPDIAPQLQTLAQQETLKKIVKTACHRGILEEANTKAQLAITQFLTTTGYEQVEVKTRAVDVKTCEQSTSN
ncbi:DUF4230 domain-containing protein [Gloeothece citriformis]|uniref:DUF4230 domain-containing protein n=1 Tax=Gloeothece citriformis TaxID=2546356 RepID=UPI00193D65E1|nr:DUF4230 domain-containing protein [Gloeothece citriformis]